MKKTFIVLLTIFLFLGLLRSTAYHVRTAKGDNIASAEQFLSLKKLGEAISNITDLFNYEKEYEDFQSIRAYLQGLVGLFQPIVDEYNDGSFFYTYEYLDDNYIYYDGEWIENPLPIVNPPSEWIRVENLDGSYKQGIFFVKKYIDNPFYFDNPGDNIFDNTIEFFNWFGNAFNTLFQLVLSALRLILDSVISLIQFCWNLIKLIFNITFSFAEAV